MSFSRELLIGKWYRSDVDESGQHHTEYAHMAIDGSYEFTFISHDEDGAITEQIIELGDWGLVGDIHFTITKGQLINGDHCEADFSDANNYHAYQVIQLNTQFFEYRHIVSDEVFIMRRVVDKLGLC